MKKLLVIFMAVAFIACNKADVSPVKDNFLIDIDKSITCQALEPTEEMMRKIETRLGHQLSARKKPTVKPGNGTGPGTDTTNTNPPPPPPPPPPATSKLVLYLDFDGAKVEPSHWSPSTMYMNPSGLSASQQKEIFDDVQHSFSPFEVLVTTDSIVYATATTTNRQRCIITTSWEWYGRAGGVAYIGSSEWGDNTPCFVFSSLLSFSSKYVKDATTHEFGHTVNLRHQSVYDNSCTLVSSYNSGYGSDATAFAPIMGVGYYKNIVNWFTGPSYSCNAIQPDFDVLQARIGLSTDDFPNSAGSTSIVSTGSVIGTMNTSNDVDYIPVPYTVTTVSATSPKFIPAATIQDIGGIKYVVIRPVPNPNTANAISSGTYIVTFQ